MAKLTVNKTVFWNSNSRMLSGKVRNILSDHVVVAGTDGTDYILHKSAINQKPTGKIAGLLSTAAFKDKPKAPKALEWKFDPATGEHNMKWVDAEGTSGCDPSLHPEIGECDGVWKEDTASAVTQLNPELFRPRTPPPVQKLPEQVKAPAMPAKKQPVALPQQKLMQ
jgi:hypothetical protein